MAEPIKPVRNVECLSFFCLNLAFARTGTIESAGSIRRDLSRHGKLYGRAFLIFGIELYIALER